MKLVKIYSAAGQLEAEIIKGFLEAQEIQVVLIQESVGKTLGLSVGYLGQVQVLVPESQEKEARTLMVEVESGEFENTETNEDSQS